MMLDLILKLALVGVLLYLLNMLPMDATIKQVIWVVVIVAVIFWVLSALGVSVPQFGRL